MVWIIKCSNNIVTDFYFEIIEKMFKNIGENVSIVNDIDEVKVKNKTDIIITARLKDACKVKFLYRNNRMIYWAQGIEPEESLMRNNSNLRFRILSVIEKNVIKNAEFCFFVSDEMRKHYEAKYNITLNDRRYYIMPCLNTSIHKKAFFKTEKYKKNIFVYAGSMSIWQNFDEIVNLYKKIENSNIPFTKLLVLTFEREKALETIKKYNLKNYEVNYVENEELPNIISSAKYGFVIRDNTSVNRVSTPTKLSTYLSCGLIPIYSSCIKDFNNLMKDKSYKIVEDENLIESIKKFDLYNINSEEIFNEYNDIFNKYYNPDYYIRNIKDILYNFVNIIDNT